MLLCDFVIRDVRTHKASAIGITHTVELDRLLPGRDPLLVYATLTDGQGDYDVRIEMTRLKDFEATRAVARTQVRLHDRNSVGELVLDLPALPVDGPGRYALQLHANSAMIAGISFAVVQSPDGEGADVGT